MSPRPLAPIRATASWAAGFFSLRAQQSMTRLCALIAMVGAVATAIIGALRQQDHAPTVAALCAGGSVALLRRSQPKDVPAPPPPAPEGAA